MINFIVHTIRFYSRGASYVACFLAGLTCILPTPIFWVSLAVTIVLGSLANYHPKVEKSAMGEKTSPKAD